MKLPTNSASSFLLWICLPAICSCSSGGQHPMVPSKDVEAGHADAVSTYKALFSKWAQDRIDEAMPQNSTGLQNDTGIADDASFPGRRPHPPGFPDSFCGQPNNCDPSCGCVNGFAIEPVTPLPSPISSVTGVVPVASSVVSNLASKASAVLLPANLPDVVSANPTRTTLFPNAVSSGVSDDTTTSFYHDAMSAQYGAVLPLILTNNDGEPITILAFANTTRYSSFISASLVDQLGLTQQMNTPSLRPSSGKLDLTATMGYPAAEVGSIALNILAGHNDRRLENQIFTVFAPLKTTNGKEDRIWHSDVTIGLDLLNRAGALRFSDEFHAVPAKEGLGVVVQKVVKVTPVEAIDASEAGGKRLHGEL